VVRFDKRRGDEDDENLSQTQREKWCVRVLRGPRVLGLKKAVRELPPEELEVLHRITF
jgi:hypothetical protein